MPKGFKVSTHIGQKFGYLTVLGPVENCNKNKVYCQCDCGKQVIASACMLAAGRVVSCRCKRRGVLGLTSAKKAYQTLKVNASTRELELHITFEQFLELGKRDCYYCGSPPSQRVKARSGAYGDYTYNGLDRVNSSEHYTLDNIVTCCKTCNLAKNDLTLDQFKTWINRIHGRLHAVKW